MMRTSRSAAFLLAAWSAFACGAPSAPPEPTPPPHVIVISLDTVRASRLGCYGNAAAKTPHLDAFATIADRYASCTSTSSWTLPSHASMFTGLFPFEHGTHGFRVDGFVDNVHPLHPDHTTLAEELQVVGYETAGFVANTVYLAVRYGMAQGFETYEIARQPAAAVTDRALAFVDDREDGAKPLFLFVNYMDAHRPYAAYTPEETLRLPPEENPANRLEALCLRVLNEGKPPGALGDEVLGLYDQALSNLDAEVGRLLDGLRSRGMFDHAIIVVTSDHGEAFGEHGIVEHAKDVYEPLVGVPLLVKGPGQNGGGTIDTPASLVDVAGLCAFRIQGEAGDELRARFGRIPGMHPITSEIHYARPRDIVLYADRFQRVRTAFREGHYKLITGGETDELYDLNEDPGETTNLAPTEPERAAAMRKALAEFQAAGAYTGERLMPKPPTKAQVKDIDALGYGGKGDAGERDAPK